MQQAAQSEKSLSERVLYHLQSELFGLSLQLEALGGLFEACDMERCDLDVRATRGLGLILDGLAGNAYDCHVQALDWQDWKDPLQETDE